MTSNPPAETQLSREALSELDIFCDIDLDAIADLLDDFIYCHLSRGDLLMKAGELNGSVYVLLRGRLGVLADKGEEIISAIMVGELIGEISVLDKRPCSATVIALDECTLLEISESLLWSLVRGSHEFARNLLILLAERLRSMREQFGKRVEMSKATERSASLDALTGLYNRRWLDNVLPLEMSECLSKGRALSFMMMDIDHFKRYNDTWGHQAGDCVLKEVAKALKFVLRDVDYAARYGGEEFCVILPGVEVAGAQSVGQRLCDYVRQADIRSKSGESLHSVTISIGIADMGPNETPYTLIEKADRALYRAKRDGRDRVCRCP